MTKSKPLIHSNGEVRELTAADMKRFRPLQDALSARLRAKLNMRGPQKNPTKERITIQL